MLTRVTTICAVLGSSFLACLCVQACCPAPPSGKPVVNADQTVIIIWDAANKMQHFIRKATFKSEADDFGFLVPTPSEPELDESGNEAFPYLQKLTEPEVKKMRRPSQGIGCGCSKKAMRKADKSAPLDVKVLVEKEVAGFKAVVLEAKSDEALVKWLSEHGYAHSPQIRAWAKPYVEAGWKITALRVAKGDKSEQKTVAAAALRISFKTDRPLFPYREPDSHSASKALGINKRLLRIYFVADSRFQGELTKEVPWTGKVAWADNLSAENRKKILDFLKLPTTTGPEAWWLTEFEDNWPYQPALADVYFSRDSDQSPLKRRPIIIYESGFWPADAMIYVIGGFLLLLLFVRRYRRARPG